MILTEGFKLIKTYGALALGRLNTTGVEHMITLEKPNLLLIPLKVEPKLAEVTAVSLFDNPHATVHIKLV